MKVANTERLTIEQMDAEKDRELLWELDQCEHVMHFITGGKKTTWEDVDSKFIPRLKAYTSIEKGWGLFKATITETGEYIGWVLVRPIDFFDDEKQTLEDDLELGWRFKYAHWGKGYATEAAKAVADTLSELGGIKFLSALAVEDNINSINIMKKLGMAYVKTDICRDAQLGIDETVVYYTRPV